MVYDVIIVGAGTAGLTASIYARRAEKTVLVFEGASYGGQIIATPSIKNYPAESDISGIDYATKIYNQAKNLGAEFKFEQVLKLTKNTKSFKIETKNGKYLAKTVIIATGSSNKKLEIEGETQFIGKGVSYCATCDGMFFKDKIVAVVGGGNTAFEDVLYLSKIAKKVYLIHRRNEFKAEDLLVSQAKKKNNVEFILNAILKKVVGKDKVQGIEFESSDGSKSQIKVDGIFVAVGRVPDNKLFAKYADIDKFGYIISDETCSTKTAGLFVAGDCRTKQVRQLVTAAADGATAALMANIFLNKNK